ncbi:hypothetical protein ABZP36_008037 [Zizania latifolia]
MRPCRRVLLSLAPGRQPPVSCIFPALPPASPALLRLVDSCHAPTHLRTLRATHTRLLFLLRLPSHLVSTTIRVKLI